VLSFGLASRKKREGEGERRTEIDFWLKPNKENEGVKYFKQMTHLLTFRSLFR